MDSITRRHALRFVGGSAGSAAIVGASSGFLSPAFAAAAATMTLSLDKPMYEEGQLMTLTLTEDVLKRDGRKITISDTSGVVWRKLSDDGRAPIFTAVAGANRIGLNTVTATLKRLSDGATFTSDTTYFLGVQWRPRFAGDRRDRVIVGMAVTDKSNSNLRWENAMTLLGAAAPFVSARRCFQSDWISKAGIDKWADWAEAEGIYPVISFKVPGNNWAGVAAGRYNADLDLLCDVLEARSQAGRAPICVAVHHEPAGDGDLAVWATMQEYLSNRFAAYNDIFCFSTISNGFDWGPHRGGQGDTARTYPRSLIDALNRNKHILGCDTYDSYDATKLDYAQYDRTSLKIAGFLEWARANGVRRVGLGEFGCHDDLDLEKCWALINQNRDLFAYANHFNSGQNSRADWRMIPLGYAPDPAVSSYTDKGGSAASERRLTAGKRMFAATPTPIR